jgi:ABC-type nitrate/sulfonate/bicarbonate transport system substrate-binding protein
VDYQILPLMEVPNIYTALVAGQIDAGIVSPPTNSRARKSGFVELMNLAKEGPEYVSVAVGTTRGYLSANEEIARRVVRAYTEGVYLFRTNKVSALKMIQKQLKVQDPDIQEDTYNQFIQYLAYPPYVSRKGLEAVIADVTETNPAAKSAKANDFMEMRFVAALEKEGFFKKFAVK